jgi:hypothetical protein
MAKETGKKYLILMQALAPYIAKRTHFNFSEKLELEESREIKELYIDFQHSLRNELEIQ